MFRYILNFLRTSKLLIPDDFKVRFQGTWMFCMYLGEVRVWHTVKTEPQMGGYFRNTVFDFRYLAKVSMGLLQWHLSGFPKVPLILHFPLLVMVWWSNLATCDPGKLNIAGWWWNQRMLPSATNRSWALLVTCPVILFYHSLLIAATPASTHMLKFREPCGNHGIGKINSTRGNIWALSHRRIFSSPDSWMHNGNLVLHF